MVVVVLGVALIVVGLMLPEGPHPPEAPPVATTRAPIDSMPLLEPMRAAKKPPMLGRKPEKVPVGSSTDYRGATRQRPTRAGHF